MDYDTSPDFISSGGVDDWIFIFGGGGDCSFSSTHALVQIKTVWNTKQKEENWAENKACRRKLQQMKHLQIVQKGLTLWPAHRLRLEGKTPSYLHSCTTHTYEGFTGLNVTHTPTEWSTHSDLRAATWGHVIEKDTFKEVQIWCIWLVMIRLWNAGIDQSITSTFTGHVYLLF